MPTLYVRQATVDHVANKIDVTLSQTFTSPVGASTVFHKATLDRVGALAGDNYTSSDLCAAVAVYYQLSASEVEVFVPPTNPETPEQALPRLKEEKIAAVNKAAGASRAKYMTVIPGQEATYLMKEAEAKAWVAATSPVATDYPILNAEATACNMTMADTVTLVLTTAAQFRALAAHIEGLRRGAIVAIEGATTTQAVLAAAEVTWP